MQVQNITSLAVLVAASFAADTNGAAVDIRDFHGLAKFLLNSGQATGNANATSDVKIQHSADGSTNWTDTGVAFAQVTNAAASFQEVMANVDNFKRYLRAVVDLGGTTPAVVCGVTLIGKKQSQ